MSYDIGHKVWLVETKMVEPETKTDENGVVWKKVTKAFYDTAYTIIEGEVIGKIIMEIEGYDLWDDEPFYNQYAVKIGDGLIESIAESDMNGEDWGMHLVFHSEEDAKEWISQKEKLNK
jgi:hypothetical protein